MRSDSGCTARASDWPTTGYFTLRTYGTSMPACSTPFEQKDGRNKRALERIEKRKASIRAR